MIIILTIAVFIILLIVIEYLWWAQTLQACRVYIFPVIEKYRLENVPISPRFFGAVTANKERITMCVRHSYSIQQLSYVLLHEYAHVLTKSIGHEPDFWVNFQTLLADAKSAGIEIDDYFATNKYCS
jgi:hypothetical protein